jgi:glycosyltransferase Alg8
MTAAVLPPTPGVTQYAALLPRPGFWAKWNPRVLAGLAVYLAVCLTVLFELPNELWDPAARHIVVAIGGLSLWRFGWWTTHVVRAWIYAFVH